MRPTASANRNNASAFVTIRLFPAGNPAAQVPGTQRPRQVTPSTDPIGDQTFGPRVLVNAAISRSLGSAWLLTLGADNLFNAYPEKNNVYNDFGGMEQYPNSSPFGYSGAYWYATASYRW